ncbi:MAG: hypothetical protein JNM14_09835 [Ferruginibacter sp.]|nr:hypothetical protein [Ferruginibacter sp.]
MKKYLLILTLMLGSFSMAFAQENPGGDDQAKQERIKALYVAYVTQQLQLTPDEAQKFWPLHTQFENELMGVKKDLPELDKEQARLNIKKKYQDGFIKILGNNRCERFFGMRDAFRKKLIEKRMQNPQRQKPIRRGQ